MDIIKFSEFDDNKPVNEEFLTGALVIGGFIAALGSGALINYASSAWTKWMMERKYKPTGKEEMVKLQQGDGESTEHKFIEVKDKETGETFMGVSVVDATVADPGYENEQFFLFDKKGFEELKDRWLKGDSSISGHHKSWSKTPANN